MSASPTPRSTAAQIGLWALVPLSAALAVVGLMVLAVLAAVISYAGFYLVLSWVS